MEQVKSWVLSAGAVVLALLILATLVRAVLGPGSRTGSWR